jgi:hypothetical protein
VGRRGIPSGTRQTHPGSSGVDLHIDLDLGAVDGGHLLDDALY